MCYAAIMETKPTQRDRTTENRIVQLEHGCRDLEMQVEALHDEMKALKEHVLRLGLPSVAPKP